MFQLPYYIDGDVKLTQTNAIMRHIARKHNLGKRPQFAHPPLSYYPMVGRRVSLTQRWCV